MSYITLPLVAKMLATIDPTAKVQIIPTFKGLTSKKLTCWTDNYPRFAAP